MKKYPPPTHTHICRGNTCWREHAHGKCLQHGSWWDYNMRKTGGFCGKPGGHWFNADTAEERAHDLSLRLGVRTDRSLFDRIMPGVYGGVIALILAAIFIFIL